MESWRVALVVLAAVMVGAAIPVVVQLRATLRTMEKTLQRSGARLDEALGATTAAAGRIDALVVRLEEGRRIEQLVAPSSGRETRRRITGAMDGTREVASRMPQAIREATSAAQAAFTAALKESASVDSAVTVPPSPDGHHS